MATKCKACGVEFTGLLACHCSVCHSTFPNPKEFDDHRKGPINKRECAKLTLF